jgi:two-component SAPR family response regulator
MPSGDPRRLFALTEAINAYRGPFLPSFTSNWIIDRRRLLERKILGILILHAEEALVRGLPRQAIESLRRAVELEPLRDDLNFRYLEVLGRLERRNEVVGHYRRYVRLLADELGLDPPDALRNLYERLII